MSVRSAVLLDRRMIAAIRAEDPLGRPVIGGVTAEAESARFFTKPDGTIILKAWSQLKDFDTAFENQPASPAVGSRTLDFLIKPRGGAVMPRRASIALPRDPDPANATNANSLFRAVTVTMPASAAMAVPGQACGMIAKVVRDTDDAPIAGAVCRLTAAADAQLTTLGVTNRNGEAMLLIAALPLAVVGAGAQLTEEHDATLELFVDPAAVATNGQDARPLDPDMIVAAGAPHASTAVKLKSRKTMQANLRWTPP